MRYAMIAMSILLLALGPAQLECGQFTMRIVLAEVL